MNDKEKKTWLQDTAAVLEERGVHGSHWSWLHNPKNPLTDTFDCNTQKTGFYETMKAIFENPQRNPMPAN